MLDSTELEVLTTLPPESSVGMLIASDSHPDTDIIDDVLFPGKVEYVQDEDEEDEESGLYPV